MALARLITRTPEFAQTLARSLQEAGYSVEFISPEEQPTVPAELEVNLDDPNAAGSYLVTADGKEISFAYDPIEREFVLTPLWRKCQAFAFAMFAPVLAKRLRHEKTSDALVQTPPIDAPSQPFIEEPSAAMENFQELHGSPDDVTPTTVMPAEVDDHMARPVETSAEVDSESSAVHSLYLPDNANEAEAESVEFSGAELFDGQGVRKHESQSVKSAPAGGVAPETGSMPSPPPIASESAPAAWLASTALRAESLGESISKGWKRRRTDFAIQMSRLGGHDASWLRATPVAALITVAFLLGWGLSGAQRPKSPRAQSTATSMDTASTQAAVLPVSTTGPVAKPVAAKPALNSPRYQRPARRWESDEDSGVAEDVIVRHYPKHYPSKGVSAANQKTAVKRFSDIE